MRLFGPTGRWRNAPTRRGSMPGCSASWRIAAALPARVEPAEPAPSSVTRWRWAKPPRNIRPSDGSGGKEIDRALGRLEPDQREAFLLKHVEDLSYEEMAALTGAGISALKMRVKRACERLRVLLGEAQHA